MMLIIIIIIINNSSISINISSSKTSSSSSAGVQAHQQHWHYWNLSTSPVTQLGPKVQFKWVSVSCKFQQDIKVIQDREVSMVHETTELPLQQQRRCLTAWRVQRLHQAKSGKSGYYRQTLSFIDIVNNKWCADMCCFWQWPVYI